MDALPQLLAEHPIWIWFAIGALFLAVEAASGSGWLLWPAGSAALTGLATLAWPLGGTAAIALFAVLTILSTYLGRRYLVRGPAAASDVNDPLARLVGHRGEAVADFDGEDGRVFVDGKEWSALLEGGGPLAAGAKVEVVAVLGGARLKVKPA